MKLRRSYQFVTLISFMKFRLQQFNIVVMNFYVFQSNAPCLGFYSTSTMQPQNLFTSHQYLNFISIALALDFNRFQSLIKSKILTEEQAANQAQQSLKSKRYLPLPEVQQPQKVVSQCFPKQTLEIQVQNNLASCKVQSPNLDLVQTLRNKRYPLAATKPVKIDKSQKSPKTKSKKNVVKFQKFKRQDMKRFLEVSPLGSAECPRCILTYKDKNWICQRLAMRRVEQWGKDHQRDEKKEFKIYC